MLGIWINNYPTTDSKHKLMAFRTEYTFDNQDNGARMFLVIVKMVHPDTRAGCSYINRKLEIRKMSQFKHNILRYNLHIEEFMNNIYIYGETYS